MGKRRRKKMNLVEWAMHYRQIIILLTCCLMAFGIYGLDRMNKNEFPDFTIRQGIVAAVCPGYTAEEIEEQIAKPLENYIFSYKEVKKSKTYSTCSDGMVMIQVQLNDNLQNKDEFWSKFKHGMSEFKAQLPAGVLAVQVVDDFGDTSALLITLESESKTYRELNDYADDLRDRLRRIEDVGRMNVYGMQLEQISVYVDNDRLARYGFNDRVLATQLLSKGFITTGGRVKDDDYVSPVYVSRSMNSVRDLQEMIIFALPNGTTVRLKDVADVVREYPEPDSYIHNNGKKCIVLSVEMKKGKNIVDMGKNINQALVEFQAELPDEVSLFKITDQCEVVERSVSTFLRELMIAICAVVIVVMLLLPIRVALVAASTIPITIFISLGLFYAFDIELNTVTLAALLVTLGMIVDNSIVIIDSYMELLAEGVSRWNASITSAVHFFKSIFSATLAISITFFPFLLTLTAMVRDFVSSFPWAITIVLSVSLLVAELLIPFMQFLFIKKPIQSAAPRDGRRRRSFLDILQSSYNKLITACFAHPRLTLVCGIVSVGVGFWLMTKVPQRLLPYAERNQFAVEIFMPTGTAVEKTAQVADSLEHILRADDRVLSVASFIGCSSPRFQSSYAPQPGGANFAQFIVNTTGNDATVAILDEYTPRYRNAFPEAVIRFRQLQYSEASYPIEIRLSSDNIAALRTDAERLKALLRQNPNLNLVQDNFKESLTASTVRLDEESSTRLGLSNADLETTLALRYGAGVPVGTVWENDYDINVVVKSNRSDSATFDDLRDEQIPIAGGLATIPLRQVASIEPTVTPGQIVRRNGIPTVTVMAEVERGVNIMNETQKVLAQMDDFELTPGVTCAFGGELEENEEQMPHIMTALIIAVCIIYFILVWHFKRILTASLLLCCLTLCFFGTALGVLIQGVEFGMTAVLGLISLMGIIVRNGIIMIDYAEELRSNEKMSIRDAIFHSAQRRMRPIFLTSAAASMGVIPMILGGSTLWMPMGTVIFYGTLITMFFILTIIPIAYWAVLTGTIKRYLTGVVSGTKLFKRRLN
jgi:multidrug efflux pump subunit AcrB